MAEIYALAESVLVWLGPEEHQSEKALHMLDNLGSEVEVDWPSRIVKSTLTGDVVPHERWGSGCSRINNDVSVAIFHILDRPWFERLWVRQEITLASSQAVVICGHDVISWNNFRKAVYVMRVNGSPRLGLQLPERIGVAFDLCDYEDKESLLLVLRHTRNCKCSDPRDRVFALLSLVERSPRQPVIIPDYRKTCLEVYRDLLLQYAHEIGSLDLLTYSELQDNSASQPTWIPDLSNPTEYNDLWMPQAAGQSRAQIEYDGSQVMKVTGLLITTVRDSSATITPGTTN